MTCAAQCDSGGAAVGWAGRLKWKASALPLVFPLRLISGTVSSLSSQGQTDGQRVQD